MTSLFTFLDKVPLFDFNLFFNFGIENRKEQLKKAPYTLIKQSNNIQNENISDKYITNVFLARHDH